MFGDDEVTFREILTEYIQPSREIVDEIYHALDMDSPAEVQKAAHKLKSASRSIGANALADLSLILETAGKANDMKTIKREVEKLSLLFGDVIDYIETVKERSM
jgi:HPt (histidine-containing phosphotransfer) domain-containing protein